MDLEKISLQDIIIKGKYKENNNTSNYFLGYSCKIINDELNVKLNQKISLNRLNNLIEDLSCKTNNDLYEHDEYKTYYLNTHSLKFDGLEELTGKWHIQKMEGKNPKTKINLSTIMYTTSDFKKEKNKKVLKKLCENKQVVFHIPITPFSKIKKQNYNLTKEHINITKKFKQINQKEIQKWKEIIKILPFKNKKIESLDLEITIPIDNDNYFWLCYDFLDN